MLAIIKKELWTYFGTLGAYLVALLFLVISSLFLWFLDTDYNIFEIGNANAKSFFQLAPWLLLFLIPALTMRSFAEEHNLGTLQALFSKPITLTAIISGKFISIIVLILFCCIPTSIFMYTLHQISIPKGNIDIGVIISSYIGLLLLSICFIAIGIWTSVLTKNVVYAYLLGVFLNFITYFGFEKIASFDGFGTFDFWIKKIGLTSRYTPFTNGLIDTRDIVYCILFSFLFLFLSFYSLKKLK